MTKIRSAQHDQWDDTFWNTNHENRKAKSKKTRDRDLQSSAIRQGIDDYFQKSQLDTQDLSEYLDITSDEFDKTNHKPRI